MINGLLKGNIINDLRIIIELMFMKLKKNILLSYFVLGLLGMLVFGCQSNFKEVQKINFSEFSPTGEADSLTLKYTDSGKIKAILVCSKMLDYASVEYPFTEFPKGILVTLYDNKAKKTFVRSDFATSFKGTDVIDLNGNVTITTEQGQILRTDQMYYDQKNEWFYTDKIFTLTDPFKGSTAGQGIDFDKDLKVINYQKVSGVIDEAE